MTISLHRHFIEQVQRQPAAIRAAVFDAILALPDAFRRPAQHSGLGLRKLHPSGVWEVRIGLDLRALLQTAPDTAVLRFLGTHDEVRKYLKNL
jgi:hypothetical protein